MDEVDAHPRPDKVGDRSWPDQRAPSLSRLKAVSRGATVTERVVDRYPAPPSRICVKSPRPYGRGSGRRLISWSRGREAGGKRAFFTQTLTRMGANAADPSRLFVAQRFHRVEPCCFARRPDAEEQSDTDRDDDPQACGPQRNHGRQARKRDVRSDRDQPSEQHP